MTGINVAFTYWLKKNDKPLICCPGRVIYRLSHGNWTQPVDICFLHYVKHTLNKAHDKQRISLIQ